MLSRIALTFLLLVPSLVSWGQNQLILFSRERVLARFSYGDDFIYRLKNSKKFKKSFVTEVREFSVITFNDTIPFNQIDRVSLRGTHQRKFSLLSKALITAGVAYFVIDEFNNIIVQGNKPDLEPSVWKPSLVLVTVGYLLKWVRKGSQRIRYPARLVSVPRGSPLYKSNE